MGLTDVATAMGVLRPIRILMALGILCLAVALSLPARGLASAPSGYTFDILFDGNRVGQHKVRIIRDGERTRAVTEVNIAIKLAFITVYSYEQRVEEVLVGDTLESLYSVTNNNGDRYIVDAKRDGETVAIDSTLGQEEATASIVPSTFWRPETTAVPQILDTQKGRLFQVQTTTVGEEQVEVENGTVQATLYRTRGDANFDVWYTPEGEWARLVFDFKGNRFEYTRAAVNR